MTNRLLSLIIVLFITANWPAFSQKHSKIPYPILFVHGWNGSDAAWYTELAFLANQGLNVDIDYVQQRSGYGSRIDFMLNATNSTFLNRSLSGPLYGDVLDMGSYLEPNNDVFAINFDVGTSTAQSNQAAAAKQGFAVGLAVKKILAATGAEKVVLFGHSMGGLAIREYLQNNENWLLGDNHHVAKAITTGTPHGGSDISAYGLLGFFGFDEWSDAVRDLRTNIAANYLWGGHEANVPKAYNSRDIDCDGYSGMVVGLNRKNIPTDLAYSCIVGIGGNSIGWVGYYDDDVVQSQSANLFNFYSVKGDLFITDNNEQQAGNTWEKTWHTKLPKQTFFNQYALDEPEDLDYAYYVSPNQAYKGFLTPPPTGQDFDRDRFILHFETRGAVTFQASLPAGASGKLTKADGDMLAQPNSKFFIQDSGDYIIQVEGKTGADAGYPLHFRPYEFFVDFCPFPKRLEIFTESPTKFCDGQSAMLKIVGSGYDSYDWFLNDRKVGSGVNLLATAPGHYYAKGNKCGLSEQSLNEIVIEVNPIPARPLVTINDMLLVSNYNNGNQWFKNGVKLVGDTLKTLTINSGFYKVLVTQKGCSSESEGITITGTEPVEDGIAIYPNPSDGKFQVKVGKGKLWQHELLNLSGQVIYVSKEDEPVISSVPTGLYILQSRKGEIVIQNKIVVK